STELVLRVHLQRDRRANCRGRSVSVIRAAPESHDGRGRHEPELRVGGRQRAAAATRAPVIPRYFNLNMAPLPTRQRCRSSGLRQLCVTGTDTMPNICTCVPISNTTVG